jgi:hypothetical protein
MDRVGVEPTTQLMSIPFSGLRYLLSKGTTAKERQQLLKPYPAHFFFLHVLCPEQLSEVLRKVKLQNCS